MAVTLRKTRVDSMARFKVEYEWRPILWFIGHWEEVQCTMETLPDICISTSGEPSHVFVNDIEYTPKKKVEK